MFILGNLKVFITSKYDLEVSQYLNIFINPLFMHRLIDSKIGEEYLMNKVTINGNVTSNDIYTWFNICIQDFEMSSDDDFNNICFENPF